MLEKQVRLFESDYMSNFNENEAENEKQTEIDLGLDMDTNVLNIK